MIQVTKTEWVVLTFIRHWKELHMLMPTTHQIAKGCGLAWREAYLITESLVARDLLDVPVGVLP